MMEQDISEIIAKSPFSKENPVSYIDTDLIVVEDIRHLPDFKKDEGLKFNVFLLCDEGRIEVRMDGHTYTVSSRQILIYPSNLIVEDYMISADLRCHVLCVTDRLLKRLFRGKMDIWSRAIYIDRLNIISVDTPEKLILQGYYYKLIKYNIKHSENPFRKEIITTLLYSVAIEMCAYFITASDGRKNDVLLTNPERVYNKFMVILSGTEVKKRDVNYYAEQLFITPKYLSKICKDVSGKTASQWIKDSVLEDIKYCLGDPDMTLKEIASALGFVSPSYFGRFVKERFGVTPVRLREETLRENSVSSSGD